MRRRTPFDDLVFDILGAFVDGLRREVFGSKARLRARVHQNNRTVEFESGPQPPPPKVPKHPKAPRPPKPPAWRRTLGFKAADRVTLETVEAAFRKRALKWHPDHGGSDEKMRKLIEARKLAYQEVSK